MGKIRTRFNKLYNILIYINVYDYWKKFHKAESFPPFAEHTHRMTIVRYNLNQKHYIMHSKIVKTPSRGINSTA